MSGPKGYSVRVESAAERRRRETAEAEARCTVLGDQLAAWQTISGTLIGRDIRAPRKRTLEALQEWELQLRQAVGETETLVAEKRAAERLAAMTATVNLDGLAPLDLGISGTRSVGSSSETTEVSQIGITATQVQRLLTAASELSDASMAATFARQANALLTLDAVAAKRELLGIETDIAAAVKQQRVRLRCQRDAQDVLLSIAHLEGEGIEELRASAAGVETPPEIAALRERAAELTRQAEAEADAEFVTAQAIAVLSELGYRVDEAFEMVGHDAAVVLAHRRDLPNHALRVQVNRDHPTVLTKVVAVAPTTEGADTAAEEITCGDVDALADKLGRRGVRASRVFNQAAGALPLDRVEQATRSRQGKRRARRIDQKVMEMRQ